MFNLFKRFMKDMEEDFQERFEEARNENVKIVIDKKRNGQAKVEIEGTTLGIMIALAGATEQILKSIGANEEAYDFVRNVVGTSKVEEE